MELKQKIPRQSVNSAYLRQGASELEIATLSDNLFKLIDSIDPKESEENVKNHLSKFLRDTYYKDDYEINTKDKTDLVIYMGKTAKKSKAGVLIEVKRPTNTTEMVTTDNLNAKAMHEIILYYFEERDKLNNNEVKHLIVTNIYEWFIFDVNQFDKLIYRNSKIKKLYTTYVNDKKDKPFFYEEVSKIIPQIDAEITGTFFDIRKYEKNLKSEDLEVQEKLIPLFKIFSATNLLKIPFENDSNSLNKPFYNELLYIIGLEEKPESGKRVIKRVNEKERQEGALIENIITKLQAHRILDDIDEEELEGETIDDRYFNIALELAITWINRILFLKLLESQLLSYHDDDTDYAFLATDKVLEFDNLDALFFEVLAEKTTNRPDGVKEQYPLVPYLNSSLFEPTDLERKAAFISSLKDKLKLPVFSKTALKDKKGKLKKGEGKPSLEYLLDFLTTYDFGVEGKEAIKKESKTIINASVLGRIFEKINGYKEGSFFTPGTITEYMCKVTIRKTVIDKFSKYFDKEFDTFEGLCNFIRRNVYEPKEILAASQVVYDLKICDPAVGSGHFLVSALNEIIAIKSELGILCDKKGKIIESYIAKVDNDELIIEDKDENQLQYTIGKDGKPNTEIQRIQETIFHEKETIIENCLFGVDINQNSIKICRLRLWIELLKNAYYTKVSNYKELQTLPNIDINIKQGNSLLCRFRIDDTFSHLPGATQQKMRLATEKYKEQVFFYKSTDDKATKKNAEKEIERIKKTFSTITVPTDKDYQLWQKKEAELAAKQGELQFGGEKERKKWGESINKLAEEALALKEKYEEKLKTLYGNAFEWRFEFPEVLDIDGVFKGFDVVIGNPPYLKARDNQVPKIREQIEKDFTTPFKMWDMYIPFVELGLRLLSENGRVCMIIPDTLGVAEYTEKLVELIENKHHLTQIDFFPGIYVFEYVGVHNKIVWVDNQSNGQETKRVSHSPTISDIIPLPSATDIEKYLFETASYKIDKKDTLALSDICFVSYGLRLNSDKNDEDYTFKKRDLVSEKKTKIHKKLYTEGKYLDHYQINKELFVEWGTDRCPARLVRPTFPQLYPPEKLLLARQKKLATYSDKGHICDNTIIMAILAKDLKKVDNRSIKKYYQNIEKDRKDIEVNSEKFNLKYILGIINSKLMDYFMKYESKGRIDFYPDDWKTIPIKVISLQEQKKIADKVNKILDLKSKGPTKAKVLEDEIDEIVYELYDLKPEEIEIIKSEYEVEETVE